MHDPSSDRFVSRHHPGASGALTTFLHAYTQPLPYVLLPLMVVALSVALRGGNVEPFLFVYFPLAFVGAALWTLFGLYRRVVEITLDVRGVCLRTAWEVARGQPCQWKHVHGLRYGAPWITFAWGRAAVELDGTDWPREPALLDALRSADAHRLPVPT